MRLIDYELRCQPWSSIYLEAFGKSTGDSDEERGRIAIGPGAVATGECQRATTEGHGCIQRSWEYCRRAWRSCTILLPPSPSFFDRVLCIDPLRSRDAYTKESCPNDHHWSPITVSVESKRDAMLLGLKQVAKEKKNRKWLTRMVDSLLLILRPYLSLCLVYITSITCYVLFCQPNDLFMMDERSGGAAAFAEKHQHTIDGPVGFAWIWRQQCR